MTKSNSMLRRFYFFFSKNEKGVMSPWDVFLGGCHRPKYFPFYPSSHIAHFSEKGSEKASKPKTYKCSPCDKTFDSHNSLQMHNAVSHAKTEPLEFEPGITITNRILTVIVILTVFT